MSEEFTYNQISEQESSAYMNQSGDDPTVLVKRTDGRITVGRLDMSSRNISFSENGEKMVEPGVSMEALSDKRQAQLAEELAGVALRSNEVSKTVASNEQVQADKLPENEIHGMFWKKHTALIKEVNRAVEQSGHIDPSMLAYEIASEIESIRQIKGLNPDMVIYLKSVIDLCDEVGSSGRDQRSKYYRNGRAGLQQISEMIRAIR
ncbi:MAG: hypothetical protein ACSLEY_01490 [Candidatus Saccharimonadales bacterium]